MIVSFVNFTSELRSERLDTGSSLLDTQTICGDSLSDKSTKVHHKDAFVFVLTVNVQWNN